MRSLLTGSGATCVLRLTLVIGAAVGCGQSGSTGTSSSTNPSGAGGAPNTRGLQATPTPAPTPTPTVSLVVHSDILDTIHSAVAGAQIVVPPGVYAPLMLSASDVHGPITLIADVTGTLTNSAAAPVIIDAHGSPAAITLSGIPADTPVAVDGFTLRGGVSAGLAIDGSPGTVAKDCTLENNRGDAVLVTGSDESLLFNNLIYGNTGAGIRVLQANAVRIINNTLYRNQDTGITLGDGTGSASNAQVENNIINGNIPVGIAVAADSLNGYVGDYNLNSDQYASGTPAGLHDLNAGTAADPQFVFASTGRDADFHLAADSPAIDAEDPQTAADLISWLQQRSTAEDGTPDCQLVALGYHYPTTQSCAGPTPGVTVGPTKKGTHHHHHATPTPTP